MQAKDLTYLFNIATSNVTISHIIGLKQFMMLQDQTEQSEQVQNNVLCENHFQVKLAILKLYIINFNMTQESLEGRKRYALSMSGHLHSPVNKMWIIQNLDCLRFCLGRWSS